MSHLTVANFDPDEGQDLLITPTNLSFQRKLEPPNP